MEFVSLGNANCIVSRTAFCVEPIVQNHDFDEAVNILTTIYLGGTNFFDCGNNSPEMDKVVSYAFNQNRKDVRLAIHVSTDNPVLLEKEVEKRLEQLLFDYVDLLIFDDLTFVPQKGGSCGLYEAAKQMQRAGKILSIGFANNNMNLIKEAVTYNIFDLVQFPYNIFSSKDDEEFLKKNCNDFTLMATNPMANGRLENIPLICGFYSQYEDLITLWDFYQEDSVGQVLYFANNPPELDGKFFEDLENLRK